MIRLRALWRRFRLWLRLRWIARLNRDVEWTPQTGYQPVALDRNVEATSDGRLYARGKGGEIRRLDDKRGLSKRQRKALAELDRQVREVNRSIRTYNGEELRG